MSAIQGFNFDKEKLDTLLEYFERGQMSVNQAQDLKRMLEELHRRVLDDGDLGLDMNV
jgi:hypothetical protein